jgi:hypothetical protein
MTGSCEAERVHFGAAWSTNFTVASTDPKVFIVPSEHDEGGLVPGTLGGRPARRPKARVVPLLER